MRAEHPASRAAMASLRGLNTCYHVSLPKHRDSIEVDGLKPHDRGWGLGKPAVFVFTDLDWMHQIASSVGMVRFDLWSFPKPTGLQHDNVAEMYSRCSYYTLKSIPPQKLRLEGTFDYDFAETFNIFMIDGAFAVRKRKEVMTPAQIKQEQAQLRKAWAAARRSKKSKPE